LLKWLLGEIVKMVLETFVKTAVLSLVPFAGWAILLLEFVYTIMKKFSMTCTKLPTKDPETN